MARTFINKFVENISQNSLFSLFTGKKKHEFCNLSDRERSMLAEAVRLCHEHAVDASSANRERFDYLADRMNETLKSVPDDACTAATSGEQIFWLKTAELMLDAYSVMPAKHDRMENWSRAVLRKMSREQKSALESMPTYQTFAEKADYLSPVFESALTYRKNFVEDAGIFGAKAARGDTVSKIADKVKNKAK